jgi:RNA polymerase sigma factor (sigma-70 family)
MASQVNKRHLLPARSSGSNFFLQSSARIDIMCSRCRVGQDASSGRHFIVHAAVASGENSLMDRRLLETVFLQATPGLLAFVEGRIPSSMRSQLAAEDVLQDVWILAGRSVDSFQPDGDHAMERWLMRITRNALIDRIKAKSRAKRSGHGLRLAGVGGSSMLDLFATVASGQRSPSKDARTAEAERVLLRALDSLPENRRQAIWMKYIDEVPTCEIAKRMDRTESAVRSLLAQGLTQLRRAVGRPERFFSDTSA